MTLPFDIMIVPPVPPPAVLIDGEIKLKGSSDLIQFSLYVDEDKEDFQTMMSLELSLTDTSTEV